MRGTLFAFDGPDHVGKTTQAQMLVNQISCTGSPCELMRFPDRSTPIGELLNQYMTSQVETEPRVISLLFAANRHEHAARILEKLRGGTHVVLDRSSYSGIAYAMSLGLPMPYCESLEAGLPKPDVVFNLGEPHTKKRPDWGSERYDTLGAQIRVRIAFGALFEEHRDVVVDVASDGPIEQVAWTVAEHASCRLAIDTDVVLFQ